MQLFYFHAMLALTSILSLRERRTRQRQVRVARVLAVYVRALLPV
jgi:hypothetical protein